MTITILYKASKVSTTKVENATKIEYDEKSEYDKVTIYFEDGSRFYSGNMEIASVSIEAKTNDN